MADAASAAPIPMRVLPGRPYPLGATWDGMGVNFALFSENATKVELCLFDSATAQSESQRIVLPERNEEVWHGYLPDLRPGQLYGCGNSLNVSRPCVLKFILDSLRYWVSEMHVDGFRFDLCSSLARQLFEVDRLGAFFDIIHQDPMISQVKLIAEPWDLGPGGYQVGNFPVLWTEWNGKYRDCLRRFWKGDGGTVAELATRLSGSSDLYQQTSRMPSASLNFVTCHDGFTLRDLVCYQNKHNTPFELAIRNQIDQYCHRCD